MGGGAVVGVGIGRRNERGEERRRGRRKGRKMWRGNRRKKAATDYPLGRSVGRPRAAGLSKFIDRQRDFDRIDVRGICRKMGRMYGAFSSLFPTPPSPEVYCLRGEVDHGEMIGSTIREGESGNLLNCHLVFSFSRYPFPSLLSCHCRRRALLCRGGEMGGGGGLHFIAEGRMRQCSSTNSLKQCRSALFCLRALSPLPSLDEGRYHTLVRRSCPPDRGRSVSLPRKRRLKRLDRNESCTQDGAVELESSIREGKGLHFYSHTSYPNRLPPSL